MSGRRERLAEARARASQGAKPRTQTPAYLLFVNRPLGAVVARHAFAVRATPDQLTAAGVATAAVALVAVSASPWAPLASVAGAALLLVAYVFDSADGQLARLRGGGSAAGEWLDHVVDIAKTSAIHAVVVVVLLADHRTGWVAVPLVFGLVSGTSFFSLTLRDQLLARSPARTPQTRFQLRRALTGLPNDHAAVCVVVGAAGWPSVFVPAYTALCFVSALLLARSLRRSHAALAAGGDVDAAGPHPLGARAGPDPRHLTHSRTAVRTATSLGEK
ncbi:CDP-alcohol phosphatidyltransferase family protein [Jatrophihabitans sp. YIM 134969]